MRLNQEKFKNITEVLLKCELFENFDNKQIISIIECFSPKIYSFNKGDYIVMAGSRYQGLGILLEGNGVITKENAAGNRVMMNHIKPGSIFGEVIAFSGTEKWPSNVQAQTNCQVMFIENEMIINQCSDACSHHSQLIRNLLKSVSTRAIMLNRRVEYLSMKGINSKIACFLLEYMDKSGSNTFRLPVNRNEMAEFLNISRPSLSREMGAMRDMGIIEFHKEAVKIIDADKLKTMIEV
ncbi:transcriptional regulator, Crp/Fnr family [Ruminiclostridium papyrosolvens DSM 2782]|uniref:Transcriptional regulator, Crp/Fnr family n=1 Tax=Ruminiclostridium papyrosolvens DSM 2782 TaxID=588581 RepID=F1T9A5_9FIRM|nr:Crp/Fnr family transcriptional regulator [Ruminiclostridium papyrosolvens]EGD49087.1 transcriptional regulator, Crp/Fnr family [Ruminiclostridium papyrosolvens DSM 2782]WES35567.1 Crp/Fnr family transcriptional regulator [Ruminiclostridium papyrosolvens DSM 2782]